MSKQTKAPGTPEQRARQRAEAIFQENYEAGRRVVAAYAWAREALEQMRESAPSVPEEDLVRVFARKSQSQVELVVGQAHFLEYNATHPSPWAPPPSERKAKVPAGKGRFAEASA